MRTGHWQQPTLILLRFGLGWHLFFQGFGKLVDPAWTSEGYLTGAWGPFGWMAGQAGLLSFTDLAMAWGLTLSGLGLMLGLFTQTSIVVAAALLLAIYLARPPLDYTGFITAGPEGTELYVNKALIEVLALTALFAFRTGRFFGLDILIRHWRRS